MTVLKRIGKITIKVIVILVSAGVVTSSIWWFLGQTQDPGLWTQKVWSVSIDYTDDVDLNQKWFTRSEAVWVKTRILEDAKDFLSKQKRDYPETAKYWRCLWLYVENVSENTVRINRIDNIHYSFYGRTAWREDHSITPWPDDRPSEVEIESFLVGLDLPPGKRMFFLIGIFWSSNDKGIKVDEIAYFHRPIIVNRSLPPLPCGSWSFPLNPNEAIPPQHYKLP